MIFQIDEADEKPAPKVKAPDKQARQWIDIGVKFKQSGLTAKKFTQDNNINYGTFTKNMFRYKDSIDIALGALQAGKKSEKDFPFSDKASEISADNSAVLGFISFAYKTFNACSLALLLLIVLLSLFNNFCYGYIN